MPISHRSGRPRATLLTGLLLLAGLGLYWAQWAAAQASAFVIDRVLVSSTRFTRDLSDFTYRIRLTNQGGALVNAKAVVRSLSANTQILDNEVTLGTVAAGVTILSVDTFTLRQNRLVPFNPDDLVWTIQGQPANTRPLANAGPDQTVRTGDSVALDGTASTDADGDALSYRWTLVSRPAGSSAALNSATAGRPTFRVDHGGTYVFSLIVNDGLVDSAADEVRISTINSTPVANAGADRTVARGASVQLDGSASSDPDFDALSFTWTIVAAPTGSTAALVSANTATPAIVLDRAGSYTFRLTVSDGQLTSAPDLVSLSTENSLPVADAGADQNASVGARVTLDGRASRDADNDQLSLSWTLLSRPAGSAAVLNVSDSLQPFFTADRVGLYVAQLIVNDGFANSVPDTVTVTIAIPPNSRPTALNDSASTPAGVPVIVDVLANDSDPDAGTTLSIASFTQPPAGGAVAQVAGGLQFTPAVGFSGISTFQYTVTDGELSATAFVNVTVLGAANLAPVVNAGDDQSFTQPPAGIPTVTLNGSASDDGKPLPATLVMGWSVVSGPAAVSFSVPDAAVTDASFAAAGTYVLRLTASDGALASQDDVQVMVLPPVNSAPVLAAISDRTLAVGTALKLQLVANDPDSLDTLSYAMGPAPSGASFTAPAFVNWTPSLSQVGPHSFTVTVHDAAGASDTKSFTVTVTADNRAPVFAALGDDSTVTQARYAKGITATDPDGDAVTLALLSGPAGLALSGNTITWRPGTAQLGSFTVKLSATDSHAASSIALYRITVEAGNPPVARDDQYSVRVGETLTVAAPGVLANDVSLTAGLLSANKLSNPALGSLNSFDADGSFSYTAPAANPRPPFAIVGSLISNAAVNRPPTGIAPALADMNQDGKPDIIYFGYAGPTQVATALSGGDGHALWRDIGGLDANFCENNIGNYPGYVLGDIEDDGQIELVTVTGCRSGESAYNRLAAFGSDGSRKWVSNLLTKEFLDVRCSIGGCAPGAVPSRTDYSVLFDASLSVARLAANEPPVILVRAEIPANAGEVYTELSPGVLGYKDYGCRIVTGDPADMGQACDVTLLVSGTDGSVLQVLRSPLRPRLNRGIPIAPFNHNPPIAADLDGDGVVEIVSGPDVWKRVGNSWTLAWAGAAEPEQVAVADLDGDGRQEMVWSLDRNFQVVAGTPYGGFVGILIFDSSGQELRRIPLPNSFPGMLTLADVDGDKTPEILLTEGGNLHVLGTDGSYKWTYVVPDNPLYSQPAGLRTSYRNNVVVYDLDGDGNNEVIFSSAAGLHILDGHNGNQKAFYAAGTRYAGIQSSNTTFVTDWDNDGHADIVSFGEVGGVVTESFAYLIKSANNDWLPAAKIHNQTVFQPASVNEAGRILFDPSVTRSYRNPQQLGLVRDPRATAGTVFEYAANDGVADSNAARVFLEIKPANSPPVFTSRPPTVMQASGPSPFVYQPTVVDPDVGDTVTYSISVSGTNGITGEPYVTLDPATGAVAMLRSVGFGVFTLRITLTATDSQGASTTQTFVVRHETAPPVDVPNVVGATVLAATQALTAVDLQSAVLQEQFNAAPAGTVIAQNPVAASTQPRATTVLLTVSKGLAPAIVPNVVGLVQAQASTRLVAAGFTAGAITRQFSDTIARGEVIAQVPAAGGDVTPGPVALMLSAGNGLALRVATAVTTADRPIAFTAVSIDLDGVETPAVGLTYSIVARPPLATPLPLIVGGNIVPAQATRGSFTLTITDAAGHKASAGFAVAEPVVAGGAEPMAVAFLRMSAAMEDINGLLLRARDALAANDVPLQRSLLTQMVQRWRLVDMGDLELSIPLSPESGFAPLISQMAGFGVNSTPDDLLAKQVLKDAEKDLSDWIAALRSSSSIAQVSRLADNFGTRAARLDALTVTEWGAVNASDQYTLLLSRRIPQLYEAIMDNLAVVVGLPATRVAAFSPQFSQAQTHSLFAGNAQLQTRRGQDGFEGPAFQVNETLAELAVTEATQWVVDKVIEDFNEKYKNGKKFATDIMFQAFWAAGVVASTSHIRQFVQGEDTGTIVAGASLSFHEFNAGFSFIEGPWDLESPELNQVYVIGPTLVQQVLPFIKKFQDAMKFKKVLNPLDDDGKYKAPKEIKRDLAAFKKALEDLSNGTQTLVDVIKSIEQKPTGVDYPCVFDSDPACGILVFDGGFQSVYEYTPPPGFELFSGLPLPISFIVYNYRNNTMYFSTPAFFPTLKPKAPTP